MSKILTVERISKISHRSYYYWEDAFASPYLNEEYILNNFQGFPLFNVLYAKKFNETFLKQIVNKTSKECRAELVNKIIETQEVTENFIEEFLTDINWNAVSQYQKMSLEFVKKWENLIRFERLSLNKYITNEIVDTYIKHLHYPLLVTNIGLTEEMCCKYAYLLPMGSLCADDRQQFSEQFLFDFRNYLNWNYVSHTQKISEEFINKLLKYIVINKIGKHQILSENFIEQHIDNLNLYYIAKNQLLSNEFIRKYAYCLPFSYLCFNEKIDYRIFEEFIDKVDWDILSLNKKIPLSFMKKYASYFNGNILSSTAVNKRYNANLIGLIQFSGSSKFQNVTEY